MRSLAASGRFDLGTQKRAELYRAARFIFPFRYAILSVLALTLFGAAFNAIEPLVLKVLFDELSLKGLQSGLLKSCFLLLALGIGKEVTSGLGNWMTWQTRLRIHNSLLESMVERTHRMSLAELTSEGVGGLMTRIDRSIQGFLTGMGQILFTALPSVLYLTIALFLMFRMEPRLALLVLAFTPLPLVMAWFAAPAQAKRERLILRSWVRIYSRFNEVLAGILTVRSFAMEETEKSRFLRKVRKANQMVIRGVAVDSTISALSNLPSLVARIAAIGYGGVLIMNHEITLGTLIAFLGFLGGVFAPVVSLGGIYQGFRKASVSLAEIFSVLDTEDYMQDSPNAVELGEIKGDISFQQVFFRYEDRPILEGIDFHVPAGQTVAIVGSSGAGKTTLMALLQRFFNPESGTILLDGMDLRTIKQESLRRKIGVVLQDPLLFNDTIRNNIMYGKPDCSMNEVIAAAEAAGAIEFIDTLPQGFNTIVGERAAKLSTGERQRITIARALIQNPSIVILDEATSSLDAESEMRIQEALAALTKNRTTFIIAHRLATVVHAHKILVIKNGKIVEQGNHKHLMEQHGYYRSLVERQYKGLLVTESGSSKTDEAPAA